MGTPFFFHFGVQLPLVKRLAERRFTHTPFLSFLFPCPFFSSFHFSFSLLSTQRLSNMKILSITLCALSVIVACVSAAQGTFHLTERVYSRDTSLSLFSTTCDPVLQLLTVGVFVHHNLVYSIIFYSIPFSSTTRWFTKRKNTYSKRQWPPNLRPSNLRRHPSPL